MKDQSTHSAVNTHTHTHTHSHYTVHIVHTTPNVMFGFTDKTLACSYMGKSG